MNNSLLIGDVGSIEYVSTEFNFGDTTTINVSKPVGTSDNNLLIAFVSGRSLTDVTLPSGFSIVYETIDSTKFLGCYYKVCGSSEPNSYDFVVDEACQVSLHLFTNNNTVSPIGNNGYIDGNSTTPTANSISAYADNILLFASMMDDTASASSSIVTSPSGMTLLYDGSTVNAPLFIYYETLQSDGVTGDRELVLNFEDRWVASLIAIK